MGIWVAITSEFTLDDPKLAVLYSQNIGTAISGSSDNSNIIKGVLDKQSSDIPLEGSPGAA
ncbi:hypothetical protein MPL3356_380009 [Mesorhizobium plurifarium]|uniref:Uncharacterized protein n=1 Tax=Mesorhizobium plurifarium TaxID=69974 RepID=A0A090DWT7_MESPL|nr:hypothetical protein MPL3356_380009 [Mesorhizobium plurifarium]